MQPQRVGAIAQLVEQRTENPCVAGSIPAGTTVKKAYFLTKMGFFYVLQWHFAAISIIA